MTALKIIVIIIFLAGVYTLLETIYLKNKKP